MKPSNFLCTYTALMWNSFRMQIHLECVYHFDWVWIVCNRNRRRKKNKKRRPYARFYKIDVDNVPHVSTGRRQGKCARNAVHSILIKQKNQNMEWKAKAFALTATVVDTSKWLCFFIFFLFHLHLTREREIPSDWVVNNRHLFNLLLLP